MGFRSDPPRPRQVQVVNPPQAQKGKPVTDPGLDTFESHTTWQEVATSRTRMKIHGDVYVQMFIERAAAGIDPADAAISAQVDADVAAQRYVPYSEGM